MPSQPETLRVNAEAPVVASAETTINAPVDVVWSTLADIESWPVWNPDVSSAELHGSLQRSTSFSWKAGGMSIESELTHVDRPQVLAWTGVTVGTRAVHVSRFEQVEGGTRAVTEESFEGVLPWLLRGPLRRMLAKSLASGLDALKQESERRVG